MEDKKEELPLQPLLKQAMFFADGIKVSVLFKVQLSTKIGNRNNSKKTFKNIWKIKKKNYLCARFYSEQVL